MHSPSSFGNTLTAPWQIESIVEASITTNSMAAYSSYACSLIHSHIPQMMLVIILTCDICVPWLLAVRVQLVVQLWSAFKSVSRLQ